MDPAPASTKNGLPAYLPRPPSSHGAVNLTDGAAGFWLYSGNTAVPTPLGSVAAPSKDHEAGIYSTGLPMVSPAC